MMDLYDRAQQREQELRDDALADRARAAHAHDGLTSAERCRFCGDPIGADRRAALPGVQTCVECQADLELGRLQWSDADDDPA